MRVSLGSDFGTRCGTFTFDGLLTPYASPQANGQVVTHIVCARAAVRFYNRLGFSTWTDSGLSTCMIW